MSNGVAQPMPVSVEFPSGDPELFVQYPTVTYGEIMGSEGSEFGPIKSDPGKVFRGLVEAGGITREITREEAVAFLRARSVDPTQFLIQNPAGSPFFIAQLTKTDIGPAEVLAFPTISSGFIGAQLPARKKPWYKKYAPFFPLAAIGGGFAIGSLFAVAPAAASAAGASGVAGATGGVAPVASVVGAAEEFVPVVIATGAEAGATGAGITASKIGLSAVVGSAIKDLFGTATDVGSSVLRETLNSEITKEVGSLFGGGSGTSINIPGDEAAPSFLSSLLAKGATLPIFLIIVTVLGAVLLTGKKRR